MADKPRYITCEDCCDPKYNPGYHIGSDGNPEPVHKTLDPSQFKQPLMLDIGAGGLSSDDKFTAVDLHTNADIKATMWDIPLPDGSVEAIFSSNALEHVGRFEVVPTLREWHRLLRRGGRLQVVVPDLEWACRWWLEHQTTKWDMAIIYGHQKHEGEYHKTGFTPAILQEHFNNTKLPWKLNTWYYMEGEDRVEKGEGKERHNVTQRVIVWETEKYEI